MPTMPTDDQVNTWKEARDHLAARMGISLAAAETLITNEVTRVVDEIVAGRSGSVLQTVPYEIEHLARFRAQQALAGIANPSIDFSF
jgi:hypothetical protein